MNIQNGLFVSVLLLRGDTVFATSAGITLWCYLNFCGRSGFSLSSSRFHSSSEFVTAATNAPASGVVKAYGIMRESHDTDDPLLGKQRERQRRRWRHRREHFMLMKFYRAALAWRFGVARTNSHFPTRRRELQSDAQRNARRSRSCTAKTC